MVKTLFAAVIAVLLGATPASGDSPSARALYDEGRWMEAADAGQAEGDVEGLTLAARALVASCLLRTCGEAILPRMERAADLAGRAIAVDPDNAVEARLQLASALGVRARAIGSRRALDEGLPGRAKAIAEEALQLNPEEPWADAFLAVWHIEAARRAGLFAGVIGADRDDGLKHAETVLKAARPDPVIGAQIALALAADNPRRNAEPLREALRFAAGRAPRDAFEQAMSDRVARLSELLAGADAEAVRAYARAASEAG